jgi:hypothetical protein
MEKMNKIVIESMERFIALLLDLGCGLSGRVPIRAGSGNWHGFMLSLAQGGGVEGGQAVKLLLNGRESINRSVFCQRDFLPKKPDFTPGNETRV